MVLLPACRAVVKNNMKQYPIDYSGHEFAYTDGKTGGKAPEKAAAGDSMLLYFRFVATDTNYRFYINGQTINPSYDNEKGYIINFIMPDSAVTLHYTAVNTMMWHGPKKMPDKSE